MLGDDILTEDQSQKSLEINTTFQQMKDSQILIREKAKKLNLL
jgi:hypothetical protein